MVEYLDGKILEDNALHFYVQHPRVTYDIEALQKFGDRIKDRHDYVDVLNPEQAAKAIYEWVYARYESTDEPGVPLKPTFGGKNFADFDKLFLAKLFPEFVKMTHRRCIDIGNKYDDQNDDKLPDLELCRKRALRCGVWGKYIQEPVAHTALEDAVLCAELYHGWRTGLTGPIHAPRWRDRD